MQCSTRVFIFVLCVGATLSLGINCRGVVDCNYFYTEGTNNAAKELLQEILKAVIANRTYQNEEQIACVGGEVRFPFDFHDTYKGSLCAILQNTTSGIRGSEIKRIAQRITAFGCRQCGSAPVFAEINDVSAFGMLAFKLVNKTMEERLREAGIDSKKVRERFKALDGNGDEMVDLREIEASIPKQCLKGGLIGQVQTRTELGLDLLEDEDTNSDRNVSFVEFCSYMISKSEHLRHLFEGIDTNTDAKLDKQELLSSLLGVDTLMPSEKSVEAMIKLVDANSDGFVSTSEWLEYLLFLPIPVHGDVVGVLAHIFEHWKADAVVIDFSDDIPVSSNKASALKNLAAGGIAGAVSRTATAPLDRLKTVIMLQTVNSGGLFEGMKIIYKDGGIMGFFRGNVLNCLKIVPESATKFYVYEQLKRWFSQIRGVQGVPETFVAGSLAGVISQTLVYPLETLKVTMAGSVTKITWTQAFSHTYANGGPKAFYGGLPALFLGVIPFSGIDLAVYETLKSAYVKYFKDDDDAKVSIPVLITLACGAISSAVAQLICYPLALVRVTQQGQSLPTAQKYSGMTDFFVKTLKKEGFLGLYKGLLPNLLRVVPAVALSYVVYESVLAL